MYDRVLTMNRFFAAFVPFLCALLGVVVANLPVWLSAGWIPAPLFALMPIYFWCLVRPDLMPPFAVLAIGIAQDFFSGSAPGMWTLSFVVTYAFVDRERDVFAGLAGIGALAGFGAAALVCGAIAYLIAAFVAGRLLPIESIAMETAATVVFYIPVLPFLNGLHRHIIGPLRSEF